MPQTGPDLVSAGYPIGNALTALLGGTTQVAQPNVPAKTNLYFGFGNLVDGTALASAAPPVVSVPVPVLPGDVITKITYLAGATAAAGSPSHQWAALYTGTGSAPGTVGVSPVLIGQTADLTSSSGSIPASGTALTYTFGTPQTITSTQAPYGYVYVSLGVTPTVGVGPSLISMTAPAIASGSPNSWYATAPYGYALTHNASSGSVAPATMGTATRVANPPVVILT